jgi:hypothetical protein
MEYLSQLRQDTQCLELNSKEKEDKRKSLIIKHSKIKLLQELLKLMRSYQQGIKFTKLR